MRRFVNEEDEIEKKYDKRSMMRKLFDLVLRRECHFGRTVFLNGYTYPPHQHYSPNVVRNQKYNIITFVPMVLYQQFKFFFNLYFLIVAITQFIPQLKVGFLFTYVAPLIFVLSITMGKEAFDDIKRWRRDLEANSQKYEKLTANGFKTIPSSKIKVGDMIQIHTNMRVPADCILLRTTEKSGASFIRTDQLDGETDWKLRHAIPSCQKLQSDESLLNMVASVYAEPPKKDIYDFEGNFYRYNLNGDVDNVESLSLENTMWANTVVASGTVIGLVIYTGKETRSVMNTSSPSSKIGKLDKELNTLSKFLFILMVLLSLMMVALKKFQGLWFITLFRFILLFSSIIPISLRVNLDVGKSIYSFFIMRDKQIPGTIVRNSSIPEELGRIEYLFTDKTGTLTQNEMIFKKLNMGIISFSDESLGDIKEYLQRAYTSDKVVQTERMVREMIEAVALCHNVTPVTEGETRGYQASSPDEIALVKFSESVNLSLEDRTLTTITLKTPIGNIETYEILLIFPFTSQSKRMGIIVRNNNTGEINFYCKGADVVMTKIVKFSNWLDEECANLALEGLRTLVFAKKRLTQDEFDQFFRKYNEAKSALQDRAEKIEAVRMTLEQDMNLLGVTGVEDLLQEDVQKSLVEIRNAGIKVWMLTGDKVETAICIARSTHLVANRKEIFKVIAPNKIQTELKLIEFGQLEDTAMIIDGNTLQICLDHLKDKFVAAARNAPSVICCRCAPTQKAAIVELIKKVTNKRTAAIGDGGNDVSMIQAADVGLGIVGKEGKHASLAADFSINQFSYCTQLILWHGRNSYKRSARLSQFVIHRGLIISIIQAVFSAIYYFAAIPVFTGWLIVGYSTFYTMLPVLTIVFDEDVSREIAFTFPELYKELQLGRVLSFKTFLIWVWKAVYQGGIIMLLAILLFERNFLRIQSISFTALILTELVMVIMEVHKIHILMLLSEILSIGIYIGSIFLLPTYFDIPFILSIQFWWRVLVIFVAACLPIYVFKFIQQRINPPAWRKLA
jgi:phospholipid-translocating ATPase